MPRHAVDDPLFTHPRVSANRRRGWGLVAASILLVVAGIVCVDIADRRRASDAWFMALPLTVIPATIGLIFGTKELRRPVQMDASGRCRNRRIENAELRWHPTFAGIADEVRGVFERTSSSRSASFAELVRGRVEGRIVLDRPPFRPGARAHMWFSLHAQRNWFLPEAVAFRLRCLRETPRPLLALRSGIECVGEAELVAAGLDETEGDVELVFELPAGLPGADLLADEPVYWELTVEGSGSLAALKGRFFVPVA